MTKTRMSSNLLYLAGACALIGLGSSSAQGAGSQQIGVPNGHVYWNNGDFITTAFTPSQTMTANLVTMNCLDDNGNDSGTETFEVAITSDSAGNSVIRSAQITNNFRNTGGCDAHTYSFDLRDTTLTGGTTYYLRTKVLAGAEVRTWNGATLYYDGGVPDYSWEFVDVPNGHVYWNNGDSITTSFSLPANATAHFATMRCLDDNRNDASSETFEVAITTDSAGANVLGSAQITNNFRNTGGCDEHRYLFDFTDLSLSGSTTYYLRTKVTAGAEVRTWIGARVYYTEEVVEPLGCVRVDVPNGHVYWNDGNFITTPFSVPYTGTANFALMNCLDDNRNDASSETFEAAITTDSAGNNVIASAQITNNFRNTGGCDAHRYSFDFDDVTLTGGVTYYLRTKVLAGAEVRTWNRAHVCFDGALPDYDIVDVDVPNGHVYWNDGDYITTSFTTENGGTARYATMDCLDDNRNDASSETFEVALTTDSAGSNVIASAQISNNFRNTGGCDEHLYLFDFFDVPLAGGTTYYLRSKVLAGAEVRTWIGARLFYSAAAPQPQACCLGDDSCVDILADECSAQGGTPGGFGTTCSAVEACFLPGNACEELDPLCCEQAGGTPQGSGSGCVPPEACCLNDACIMLHPLQCESQGGTSQGSGSTCTAPQACQLPGFVCEELDPLCCEEAGGIPYGSGSSCAPEEACCLGDSCAILDPLFCENQGGTPQGPGTTCTQPQACCLGDACVALNPLCCEEIGGTPSPVSSPVCLGDGNGNLIDDACELCPTTDPPSAPAGAMGYEKVRTISLVPGNPGRQVALRVTLRDMPSPFEGSDGCQLWVADPQLITEASGTASPLPLPTFWAARLQSTPHCIDWGAIDVLSVSDDAIVPSAIYEVQAIDCDCDPADESGYSWALEIGTSRRGDVVGNCGSSPCTPPNGVADFDDISALVDKFRNLPGAPIKARTDVAPNIPDRKVDFTDIPAAVDAFRGLPYPYSGPSQCSGSAAAASAGEAADFRPDTTSGANPAVITLYPAATSLRPGESVDVEVRVAGVVDLRAYQLSATVGGGVTGELKTGDLWIDTDRLDYVFGAREIITAADTTQGRLGATTMANGIDVAESMYLGTFTLNSSVDAAGTFELTLRRDGSTFLRDSVISPILHTVETPVSISVSAAPRRQGSEKLGRAAGTRRPTE